MVAKIMACPAFFIHDPKHDGMLINSGTTPVCKNLLSIYCVIPHLLRRFLYLISYLYINLSSYLGAMRVYPYSSNLSSCRLSETVEEQKAVSPTDISLCYSYTQALEPEEEYHT
jgi:hypothetical protein